MTSHQCSKPHFLRRERKKLQQLSDESILELEQIFELAIKENAEQPPVGNDQPNGEIDANFNSKILKPNGTSSEFNNRLKKFLQNHLLDLPTIYALVSQFLSQLPTAFLDSLGTQSLTVLNSSDEGLNDSSLNYVEEFLLKASPNGRWEWLAVLASCQTPSGLDIFVREIVETPPTDSAVVMKAFAPLMRRTDYEVEWLFPGLFEGLNHSDFAPAAFDFANFCFRNGLCDEHPASERADEFLMLLNSLSKRMLEIESDPTSWSEDPNQISKMISDSVALIVSLCDAMSLMRFEQSLETLRETIKIRHRRIRSEVAFALAKFGEDDGVTQLLELVKEPVSRLRVIQYADELGLSDRIAEEFTTSVAIAESELAIWLSQPIQMGVPPTMIELVDQRNCYWPGYDEPIDCFLFRFRYQYGENSFSNIAIVGPLIHAFLANLEDLSMDDVYAAFAGWQAEHDEIIELDLSSLSPHRQTDLFKLERRLNDFGCGSIKTKILGVFFGEEVAIAECTYNDHACIAFADGNEVRCFSMANGKTLSCEEVYCIYKGRKLLDAFN